MSFLALLTALYLFRSALIGPHIQRYVEALFASQLNIRVAVGDIVGSYISDLEIHDIKTLGPSHSGPLVSLTLRRVRLAYNPVSLLKGLDGFLTDAAIGLEGARLELDLSRQGADSPASPKKGSAQSVFLPDTLPKLHIEDSSVFLHGQDYETSFRGIELTTPPSLEKNSFHLEIEEWGWKHPDLQEGKTQVTTDIQYSRERLIARRLMLGRHDVAEFFEIGLERLPHIVPFDAKLHPFGGHVGIQGSLTASEVTARITADNLDLSRVYSLLKTPEAKVVGTISMKASMLVPVKKPQDLMADLDVKLESGSIGGLAADQLNLRVAARDGKIHVDLLNLKSNANTFVLKDVTAPMAAMFKNDSVDLLDAIRGEFLFDLRDIPSLFSVAGTDLSRAGDSIPEHRVLLRGQIYDGTITLSEGALTTEKGQLRLKSCEVGLPEGTRSFADTRFKSELELDVKQLGSLSRLLMLPPMGGSLKGNVTAAGTFGAPGGSILLTGRKVIFKGKALGDLSLRASGGFQRGTATEESEIRVDLFDLRAGENAASLQAVTVPVQGLFRGGFESFLESVSGKFFIDCRNVPSLLSLAGVTLPKSAGATPKHRLLIRGRVMKGDILLSGGALTAESGKIRLNSCKIGLPAKDHPFSNTAVKAELEMDFPRLGLLSRILALPPMSGSMRGHMKVAGTLGAPRGEIDITGRKVGFHGMIFDDLLIQADADSQTAVIQSLVLERGNDRLEGRGRYHFLREEFENAQLEFRISDVGPYVEYLWPKTWKISPVNPQIHGSVDGEAMVTGPLRKPHGRLAINARNINFQGNAFGDATLRMLSKDGKITLEAMEFRHLGDRVTLKGSFQPGTRRLEGVDLEIAIADCAAYMKSLFPETPLITGSIHASLKASGPIREPDAEASVLLKQGKVRDFVLPYASLKVRSSGRRITIDAADVQTDMGEIKMAGVFLRGSSDTEFDLRLTQLTLSNRDELLALGAPVDIHFSKAGELVVGELFLKGPPGSIRLNGIVSSRGESDFRVVVSDLNDGDWFQPLVSRHLRFDGLTLRAHLTGTLGSPLLSVTGRLARISSRDARISLSGVFDLFYTKEGLSIRQFEWGAGGEQQVTVSGIVPLNLLGKPILPNGPLSLDAKVKFPDLRALYNALPEYMPSSGSFLGELNLRGTWGAPHAKLAFQCRGLYPPKRFKPMPPAPLDMDGTIYLEGKKIVLESLRGYSPSITLTCRGEVNGVPSLTDLLSDLPRKLGGEMALEGDLSVSDLSWMATETTGLRRVSGQLETKVKLAGSFSSPAINASIRLIDVDLRPDMDLPSLQSLNLVAEANPESLKLHTFKGELGGSPFHVVGSVRRKGEKEIFADLRFQGQNLLYYRGDGVKLRADTDLGITGLLTQLKVEGEVAITDGYFVKYFDFLKTLSGSEKPKTDRGLRLFSIREPPFRDAVFNINIASKNPFRIQNNIVSGFVRPDLRLVGTGELPFLVGKLYVESTRVVFPGANLVIESGLIRFDKNKPDRPILDLLGRARLHGYDITMLVEGPYDEPVVTLSSVPPLSNEDLLRLVLTGQEPRSTGESKTSPRKNLNVAVYVGRDFISRWFGSDLAGGDTILDRFDIDIGRALTRAGEETVDTRFRLVEGVFGGRDTLYITGEKDEFDFYNAGVRIVFRFK